MAKSGGWLKWLFGGAALLGGGYAVASALSKGKPKMPIVLAPVDQAALKRELDYLLGADMNGRYSIEDIANITGNGRWLNVDLKWMNNEAEAQKKVAIIWAAVSNRFAHLTVAYAPGKTYTVSH